MPTKKPSRSSAIVPASQPVERQFGTDLVHVDAVFRNPAARPGMGGPWDLEADKIAWTDPLTGYAYIILRDAKGKHLRGFVGIPPCHPFFTRSVDTLIGYQIGVHGGLDYALDCQRHEPEFRSICHTRVAVGPEQLYSNAKAQGQDEAWWLGFSCNHPGDAWPDFLGHLNAHEPVHGINDATYKDEKFVYRECVRLTLQLKAVEEGRHPTEADPGPTTVSYNVHDHRRA